MFNNRIRGRVWVSVIGTSFLLIGIYFLLYQPYERNGQLLRDPPVRQNAEALGDLRKSAYLSSRVFNISSNDVMVFLHIQKTGGTYFGKSLVKNLDLQRECVRDSDKARYACLRPNSDERWLLSRYSTGWLCGVHADWTTLTSCVPNVLKSGMKIRNINTTRLFYITVLREPVNRFLSEFKHVQRGATWNRSRFTCNGAEYKVTPCYTGMDWRGVTLTEFLSCPHNAAMNRQTRMLANLTELGCNGLNNMTRRSHTREYRKNMVKSAINTLNNMAFFGLLEYQRESQYLFEMTFGLRFNSDFRQQDNSDSWGDAERKIIDTKQLLQIRKLNRLDRRLYSYAKTLFFKRLKYFELMYK